MLKTWGKHKTVRRHVHGARSDHREPEGLLLSRRSLGIAVGSSLVLGAGGLTALAVAFAEAGPPGTTIVQTGFGLARITRAQRQERLPSGAAVAGGHAGHQMAVAGTRQPVNMTFGDHLLIQLEVFNDSDEDQMFSPGMLRLRGKSQPWPVVNCWNDLTPGLLAPGVRIQAKISFLVPSDAMAFTALFDDISNPDGEPLELPLPSVDWRPGFLEATHA